MTTHAWGGDLDEDREYTDPDPRRHDIPDLCICTHSQDDHTHSDGGCGWRFCPCPWYDAIPAVWDDEYEPEEAL